MCWAACGDARPPRPRRRARPAPGPRPRATTRRQHGCFIRVCRGSSTRYGLNGTGGSDGSLGLCPVSLKSSPRWTLSGPLAGRAVGRRRNRLRRPGRRGHPGPLRRGPRPGDRRRGGEAGRRPDHHAPPPLPAGHHHRRGRHLQGPRRAHADQERHRAARRPHQRRHGRPGSLRRPRRRPRPADHRPAGARPERPGRPPGPRPDLRTGPPRDPARVRRPRRGLAAADRAGHPRRRRPGHAGPPHRRQRRLRRQPLRGGPRRRRGRLPDRRPAPPPGVRGTREEPPARPRRRRPLGHRVALVRAGRRAARRDLRAPRLGSSYPRLAHGHRPVDGLRAVRHTPSISGAPN